MGNFQVFPKAITEDFPDFVRTMKEFTKTSNELQKKIIIWTRVLIAVLIIQTAGLFFFGLN